ncbi:DUF6346 domain-containing protein [Dactylosporangium sp. NPDC051485]|uniref:DUF6346 domain-containing protein n=1 Tax=Dactylosporangium sp. NPDC051485 TaxID=3154846 RepID=UPI00342F5A09
MTDRPAQPNEGAAGDGPPSWAAELRLRVRAALTGLVYLTAVVVVWLAFATVLNLYKGNAAWRSSTPQTKATGTVQSCNRAGPVSGDGFGYWWQCRVTVTTQDGRVLDILLGHSVVSPADAGQPVDLREVCSLPDHNGCSYGRPTGGWWPGLHKIVRVLSYFPEFALLLCSLWAFLAAALGRERVMQLGARLVASAAKD